jgi:predicted nucleotide-binding protein (sugar kinase/HSP70/actin superfamily)
MELDTIEQENPASTKINPEKKHFKRTTQRSFNFEERNQTTILIGGLPVLTDRFVANSLTSLGYNINVLNVPNMETMSLGKEYCDTALCNPTYFTVGNLILYLEKLKKSGLSNEEIIEKYIFLTAGSCGPCRFGMYEYEYEYALENAGFGGFRIIIFQMAGKLNQGDLNSGLRMDFEFFRVILNSFILSDLLNEFRYMIKPYEVEPGITERVIGECAEIIANYLRNKKPLRKALNGMVDTKIHFEMTRNIIDQFITFDLNKVLKICYEKINAIELNYLQVKPVVKITGEFWAQSTEGDGNYNMFQFLEDEGCEIIVEPLSSWVMYLLWSTKYLYNEKSMTNSFGRITLKEPVKFLKAFSIKIINNIYYNIGIALYNHQYNKAGKLLGNKHRILTPVGKLAKIASKYMDVRYDGGEGFLEVAKNIYFTKNDLAHMVLSLKPFGCMPSTISDSIQVKVMTDYNKMIFLPLETSAEGKINALSRVQMALSEARDRAVKEYESALERLPKKKSQDISSSKKYVKALKKLPVVKGSALKAVMFLKTI